MAQSPCADTTANRRSDGPNVLLASQEPLLRMYSAASRDIALQGDDLVGISATLGVRIGYHGRSDDVLPSGEPPSASSCMFAGDSIASIRAGHDGSIAASSNNRLQRDGYFL